MSDPSAPRVTKPGPTVGGELLDTSVVIALDVLGPQQLPEESAISAITLAELTAGPHATDDEAERARRQDRLQRVEAVLDPLPFDAAAARAYGQVFAATHVVNPAADRKPRGAHAVDLMTAAVALANGLPLFTHNAADFAHLAHIGLDVKAGRALRPSPQACMRRSSRE